MVTPPRTLPVRNSSAYPPLLRSSHIVVDEQRFVEVVRQHWQVTMSNFHLTVLEFLGILMPVRKVLVSPLEFEEQETPVRGGVHVHIPRERWFHRTKKAGRSKMVYIDLDGEEGARPVPPRGLRMTPSPQFSYQSVFYPDAVSPGEKPRRPRPLAPLAPEQMYPVAELMRRGLWFRPLDPGYWALVARGVWFSPAEDVDGESPTWVKTILRGESANALQLTMPSAQWGNNGVTRLYVIGSAEQRRGVRDPGQPTAHPGQDWVAGSILRYLEERSGLDLILELHDACRQPRTNANKRVFQAVAERWQALAKRAKHCPIPRLIPRFHRNVLLWLLHQNRRGVSAGDALDDLGALVGMSPESVKQAIWAGRKALTVK